MVVKEIARLEDGRVITVHLTEDEHTAVLSAGVNFLVGKGFLALGQVDGPEVLGVPAGEGNQA